MFVALAAANKCHFHCLTSKSHRSPWQALSVAGLGAGLTEAVVVNPFEVVKVSLQANRDSFKEVLASKKTSFPDVPPASHVAAAVV